VTVRRNVSSKGREREKEREREGGGERESERESENSECVQPYMNGNEDSKPKEK
jgi:hypothetical protein